MPPIPANGLPPSSPARMQPAVPPPTTSQTHSLYSNLTQSINQLVKATLPPTVLGGLLTKLGKCQDETVRLQGRLDELQREKEQFEMKLAEVQGALRVATSGRGELIGNEERAGRQREREGILERLLTENFGEVVDRIESLERELLARLPPKKKGKIVIGNGANGIIADGREKSQDLRTTRDSTVDEREREQVSVSQGGGGARESSPELMRDRSVAIEGQDQEMEVEEDVKPIIPKPREEPSPVPSQVTTTQASKNPTISTTEATPTKPNIRQNLPPSNISSLLGSASARPVPIHQASVAISATSQKQSHPLSHSSSSLALLPPSKKARLSPNPSTSLSDRISPSTSSSQAQVQAQANVPTKKQMKLQQREVISLLDDELDEFVSGKDGSATVKKRLPDVPLGAGGLIARLQSGEFAKEGQEEEVVQVPVESEAERHRQWMIKEVEKRDRERIKNEQERIKSEQAKKRNEELKLRLAAEKGKGKVQNGVGEAGTNKNQSIIITNKLPPSTTTYDSSLPPSATNRQPRRSNHLPPSNLPSKPTHTIFPASDDAEPSSTVPAVQIQRPPPNHSTSSLAVPPNQSRPSSSSTSTVPTSKPALSFSLPAQNRPPPAVNFNSSPVSAPVNPVPAPTPVTVPRSTNLLERLKQNPNGLNQAPFTPAKLKVGSMGFTPEAVKVGQTASMPRDGLKANGANGANEANGSNGTLKNQANVNLSTAPSSTLKIKKASVVPTGPSSQMRPGPAWLYEDAQKAKQLLTQSQSIPLHPRNAKPSPAPLPPSTLPAVSKPSLYATVQLNSLTPQQDKFKAQKSNNPPPPQATLPIPTEPFTFAKRSFPSNPAPSNRPNPQSNQPVPSTSAVLTHNLPPPSSSSARPNLPSKPSLQTQTQVEAQSKAEKASTLNSTQPKPVSVPIAQPAPLPSTSAPTALRPRSPSPRSPEEVRRQLGLPTRGRSRSRSRSRSFSPMNISKSSSPPITFRERLPLSSQRPRPKSPVRRSRSPLPPRRRSRSRSPHFERRRRSHSPRRRRSRSISRSPLSSSPPPPLRRSRSPEFVSPEIIRRREIGRSERRYSPEPRPSRPAWMDRGGNDWYRGR